MNLIKKSVIPLLSDEFSVEIEYFFREQCQCIPRISIALETLLIDDIVDRVLNLNRTKNISVNTIDNVLNPLERIQRY